MKANELMIGDWVEFIQSDGQGFYAQVEALNDDGTFAESGFFADNMVKPIPLTGDILEKNGFTKELYDGVHYRYGIVIDGIGFSVRYVRSVFQWLGPLDFHYVHELQHALRLCGIKIKLKLD